MGDELWREIHDALERALSDFGRLDEIRAEVVRLRRAYASRRAPNFEREASRLAYAVAYHPVHTYSYFIALSDLGLGESLFSGLKKSPTVVVLGAGLCAETLAILRWMESFDSRLLQKSRFVLADRAKWNPTRRAILTPTVKSIWKENHIEFHEETADLSSDECRTFLSVEIPRADVIICPALLSEMITERTERSLIDKILPYLPTNARLAFLDHRYKEFTHVTQQWSNKYGLKVVESGTLDKLRNATPLIFPPPSPWVSANILDGTDGLIPKRRPYDLSWIVVSRH